RDDRMKYFQDLVVGERSVVGSHPFTATEIEAFAAKYDPQPFHLDEAAAARSPFGALCASGWHTVSIWMRLVVGAREQADAEMRARGETPAKAGPSPGFRDLNWLKPVYVGDTVTFAMEIAEKRELNSRRGWGLVLSRNTGVNQSGELVL